MDIALRELRHRRDDDRDDEHRQSDGEEELGTSPIRTAPTALVLLPSLSLAAEFDGCEPNLVVLAGAI